MAFSGTAEKLNLLGMLWYHGSKSKKEAEHALESNAMDCYFIREHASTLYLSTRYRGMFYHLPISKTKDGYVLKDHYNPFTSLQELVSHHQKHSVYVDSGEFTLQTSCHKDFTALCVKYVDDFRGDCIIRVRDECIIINSLIGRQIGSWPYVFIREFRFEDEKFQFSFKSGRRGPFGVANYLFKLHSRTYYSLRETVNRIAEGKSGSSNAAKGDDVKPPIPPHGSAKKSDEVEVTYDDLPTISSVGQRSASNPDLSRDMFRHLLRKDHSSTRSSPSQPNSPQSHPKKPANSDYNVPKPATESIYTIPRAMSDPRNDYQIPKPLDETYMVPRPYHGLKTYAVSDSAVMLLQEDRPKVSSTILEHSYEDADMVVGSNI